MVHAYQLTKAFSYSFDQQIVVVQYKSAIPSLLRPIMIKMVRKKSRDQDGHREDEASNLFSEIAIVLEIDETFSARSEIPSPSSHLNEPRCEHPTSSSALSLPIPLLIGPSHRSSAYSHPKSFSDPTYSSIAIQPRMPDPTGTTPQAPSPEIVRKKKDNFSLLNQSLGGQEPRKPTCFYSPPRKFPWFLRAPFPGNRASIRPARTNEWPSAAPLARGKG